MPGYSAIIAAGADYLGAQQTRQTNIGLSREQMQFQERMSNTAFQRQAKDLEKAGLNRILGLTKGGASTPPGAMAKTENIIGPAITTALAARRAAQEIKNMKAQERLITAQKDTLGGPAAIGDIIGKSVDAMRDKLTTGIEWDSLWDQLLKDLKIKGTPHTARQLRTRKKPLEIKIPGFAKDIKK